MSPGSSPASATELAGPPAASLGAASEPPPSDPSPDGHPPGAGRILAVEAADQALYRSKNTGRNRVAHADSLDDRPGASDCPEHVLVGANKRNQYEAAFLLAGFISRANRSAES